MKKPTSTRAVIAGKQLYERYLQLSLHKARMTQSVLDTSSSSMGKAALLFVPKYGRLAAMLIEPLRDLNRVQLERLEAKTAGKDATSYVEHLGDCVQALRNHVPASTDAVKAFQFFRNWKRSR